MTKKTPSAVAAGPPDDTWHLPPRREAAGPAATGPGGMLGRTVILTLATERQRLWGLAAGLCRLGPAASSAGGSPVPSHCAAFRCFVRADYSSIPHSLSFNSFDVCPLCRHSSTQFLFIPLSAPCADARSRARISGCLSACLLSNNGQTSK